MGRLPQLSQRSSTAHKYVDDDDDDDDDDNGDDDDDDDDDAESPSGGLMAGFI